jgi:hypothetical protein
MHDPLKLVLVNGIASALLLCGLLFYIYIYPKRKIHFFFLLILITILPLLSLFRPGDYESGDFNIHIYRIMAFYDSLKEGVLMPSWAGELNATYGNPLFIFNYSLPYYFICLFHFIGFSFITSTKIYLGITYFFSGIFMFLWINKLTRNSLAAFTASIFYLFNPYHLIDMHFRATLGECTVFALAPLVFYFVTLYFEKHHFLFLLYVSLTTLLLILGHPLLAIVVLGLVVIYTACLAKGKKEIKSFIYILLFLSIGSLGSIYLWVPFVLYNSDMYPNPNPQLRFNPFYELFFSPWRYGLLFQGPKGELALMIGYSQLFAIIASVYLMVTSKIKKDIKFSYTLWLIMFFVLLFILSPLSRTLWNLLPILWMLLPTGRLLLVVAVCTSVIAGYMVLIFASSKKKILITYIFIALTISSTILNWGQRTVIPGITDTQLKQGVWKSTVYEGLTAYFLNNKWADKNHFWFSELPSLHLEVLSGQADIKEISRDSVNHMYVVNAKTPLTIKENTLFYPGWSLKSNHSPIAIFPDKRGVITARLPRGLQYVELHYEDLPIYKISKITGLTISFGLIFSCLIFTIFFARDPKHFSRKT